MVNRDRCELDAGRAMGVISTETYEALLLANVPEGKARAAAPEVARGWDLV